MILQESVLTEGQVGKLHKKYLAVSCHNIKELHMAWQLGADFATLSPVNNTLSHVEQSGMGWEIFADTVQQAKLPVYALGGMKKEDIPLANTMAHKGSLQSVAYLVNTFCMAAIKSASATGLVKYSLAP